ncbi:hypothetical protein VPHF99_0036 [Vibrio phage F99]
MKCPTTNRDECSGVGCKLMALETGCYLHKSYM